MVGIKLGDQFLKQRNYAVGVEVVLAKYLHDATFRLSDH